MKRYFIITALLVFSLVSVLVISRAANAQSSAGTLSDSDIKRIRGNCAEVQTSLSQLHASDALLRVNLGQLYESISTKLMAPLNSRIALNKLDSSSLVSTTVTYENQLNDFRSDYQTYERSLSSLLGIECQDRPVAYYDGLGSARANRKKVNSDVEMLKKSLLQYRQEFETFAKQQELMK